jgi:hypothetical protein
MSESAIMLAVSVMGALGTLVGTVWTVRGMLAKFDVRLAVMGQQLTSGAENFEELKQNDRDHAERSRRHSEKLAKHEVAIAELRGSRVQIRPARNGG